jgi:putative hemolysin
MLLLAGAVVLLLVVLNGLFSMSELAVVSSKRPKLQSRAERGDRAPPKRSGWPTIPTAFFPPCRSASP